MLIFHKLCILSDCPQIVHDPQETSVTGPFFLQKFYILNEELTAVAADFVVLASNQGLARAPFTAADHTIGVPYPFVSHALQSASDHWLQGDHEDWESLGLNDSKEVGINMDWQLADTVSCDAQSAADAQARVFLFLSHFSSAHTFFLVQLQLSFGMLYPHFESLAERKTAYKNYRDVWLPGRVPHSNVLVFPGVQGGMTNCNRLKTIPQAYDFFVVTNACTIALVHQSWRRDACRWLTLGVLLTVSLALCSPASKISPSMRIRRV